MERINWAGGSRLINKEAVKPNNQTNSAQDEETSEEFRNFDKGMEKLLSLSPEQAERIRKRIPMPKEKRKTRTKLK
jgi:hypothetical protein